jgi:hypothetical protein
MSTEKTFGNLAQATMSYSCTRSASLKKGEAVGASMAFCAAMPEDSDITSNKQDGPYVNQAKPISKTTGD